MYRVLVPVDTEESRAVAQAEYVTGLPGARDGVEAIVLFVFDEDSDEIPEDMQRSATRVGAVRRAEEILEEGGVDVTVLDDSGDPAARIIDHAEGRDIDSIVVGGRKRSSVGKALFGSVTQAVLRGTSLPVVVTGPAPE